MDENRPLMPVVKRDSKQRKLLLILVVVVLMASSGAAVWFWRQTEIDELKKIETPQVVEGDATNLVNPADPDNWSVVLLGPTLIGDDGTVTAGLSFGLPLTWTVKDCANGNTLVAYVSNDSTDQATCNSEGSSPIVMSAQTGDVREAYSYDDTAVYDDRQAMTVTIDGHQFERISAKIAQPMEFQPPAGSTITSYVAVIDGVTYAATYTREVDDTNDLTADFDKLVTTTLAITTP